MSLAKIGIRTETCYKCGKTKIASVNRNINYFDKPEMIMMSYGKNKGAFFCKSCKTQTILNLEES